MLTKKQLRKIIFGAKNLNPGQLSEKNEHNHCATPTATKVTSIYASFKGARKILACTEIRTLDLAHLFSTLQPYGRSWFA